MVGDAGRLVRRAADEAEAVGQQRQAPHSSVWCVKVRRTAPSLTLKSLMVLSFKPESACWLSGGKVGDLHVVAAGNEFDWIKAHFVGGPATCAKQ